MKTPFAESVPTEVIANLRWRAKVHRRVQEDAAFAGVLRDACSKDPVFWMNGFGFTFDPRNKYGPDRRPFPKVPFILYPYQAKALMTLIDHILDGRDILIEKSRDAGASWICVCAIVWCWRFRPLQSFLFVSRSEDYVDKSGNAKSLMWKLDFLLNNQPKWLRPKGYDSDDKACRRHMHALNTENGSMLDGESTTGSVARGDRRTAILLDEFADVLEGDSVLSSTRDATRCRIFNSTPKGTGNAFYKMRCSGIDKLRMHWSEHPVKAEGLYTTKDGEHVAIDTDYWSKFAEGDKDKDSRSEMIRLDKLVADRQVPLEDGKLRSPWYAGECERAGSAREIAQEVDIDYAGSGHQFFNPGRVQEIIRLNTRDPFIVGDLEFDDVTCDPIRFREDPRGGLRLWCMLDPEKNPACANRLAIGADISAGTGASNSCLSGMDMVTNEKVFEYASPFIRPEKFAKLTVAICKWFRGARRNKSPYLIWESNGPGRQFGSRVIECGYSNVYYRRNETSSAGKVSDIPGWPATAESKAALLGEYRAAIEQSDCLNCSQIALEETLDYVFLVSGAVAHSASVSRDDPSGARSNHGDRVTADALAWKALCESGVTVQRAPEPDIPVGCLAWRQKMRERDKQKSNKELGSGWK